jgi:hypothetical protein
MKEFFIKDHVINVKIMLSQCILPISHLQYGVTIAGSQMIGEGKILVWS